MFRGLGFKRAKAMQSAEAQERGDDIGSERQGRTRFMWAPAMVAPRSQDDVVQSCPPALQVHVACHSVSQKDRS